MLSLRRVERARMGEASFERLFARLLPLYEATFDVPQRVIRCIYDDPTADTIAFHLWQDKGTLLGFVAYKYYRHQMLGRTYNMVRMATILLPEARGRNLIHWSGLVEFFHVLAAGRARNFHIFSVLVHPRPYRLLAGLGPVVYPHFAHPTPAHLDALMDQLSHRAGLETPSRERRRAVRLGFRSRAPGEDSWQGSTDPAVAFFLEQCPGYREGWGLACIVPVGLPLMFRIVRRLLTKQWTRLRSAPRRQVAR